VDTSQYKKKNKINEMITGVGIPLLISNFVENFAMYFLIAREGIPLLILKILKKFAMYFLDCRSKHSTYNYKNCRNFCNVLESSLKLGDQGARMASFCIIGHQTHNWE